MPNSLLEAYTMYAGEKSFLIRWTCGTLVAFVIALAATNALSVGAWTPAIAGVITGLTMGIAQWLVLREHATWAVEWAAATAIGFFISIVGLAELGNVETSPLSLFMYIAVAYAGLGATLGVCQWLVLRRRVRKSGWWIPAMALAYPLGITPVMIATVGTPSPNFLLGAAIALASGLLIGALSGAALVLLLRHPYFNGGGLAPSSKAG